MLFVSNETTSTHSSETPRPKRTQCQNLGSIKIEMTKVIFSKLHLLHQEFRIYKVLQLTVVVPYVRCPSFRRVTIRRLEGDEETSCQSFGE